MDFDNLYSNWAGGTNTTTASTGCYINYPYVSTWYQYDKGEKALNVLKALRAKKLVKIETIDQFIEAMSLIMKEL